MPVDDERVGHRALHYYGEARPQVGPVAGVERRVLRVHRHDVGSRGPRQSDAVAGDYFGFSVAISGTTAIAPPIANSDRIAN